jgi:hypothetical protein
MNMATSLLLLGLLLIAGVSNANDKILIITKNIPDENLAPLLQAIKGELVSVNEQMQTINIPDWPVDVQHQIKKAAQLARQFNAPAVIWMQMFDNEVLLYLSAPKGDRMLIRRLEQAKGDEKNEIIALIIRSSVVAMKNGGKVGVAADNPEEREPVSKTVPVPPKHHQVKQKPVSHQLPQEQKQTAETNKTGSKHNKSLTIAAAYSYGAYSDSHPVNNGFMLSIGLRLKNFMTIEANTRFTQQIEAQTGSLKISVRPFPVAVTAKIMAQYAKFTIGGGIGMELIFQNHRTVAVNGSANAAKDGTRAEAASVAVIETGLFLTSKLRIFITLGAEIMIHKVDYTIMADNRQITIIEGWPVRPLAFAGIELTSF